MCRRGNRHFNVHFLRIRPVIFPSKMENSRPLKEETDGKVFTSRQSRHFCFVINMIKVFFPICTLTLLVNNFVSRQGKGINRRNESTNIIL